MALLKCKSCGANLNFSIGNAVAECEYCGTVQTIPNSDDDRKLMLLNRATDLRLDNEFDKACGIYETVVAEFPDEAEAYWGLVLCKYGIEYVSVNPFTRVPTCHRTITLPIFNDKDYKAAYERATVDSRLVYEKEASAIDEIQRKIISIANKEEPYDIFICYKESDDQSHARTEDSTIAQDIYTELIRQGYKVFLARVTLNERGVSEYEPYIFAALSTSRVMITVATKIDYINAVWVKNEWSRFISMMNSDKSKHLIPCIKNFLPEEMPAEFSGLQALNIGDVMFYKSLMNRINVAFGDRQVKTVEKVVETNVVNAGGNPSVNSLLERAFMYLEDCDWQSADEYCEKVLDIDPKIATAYLVKLMAELKVTKLEDLKNQPNPFDDKNSYQKVIRFADDELKNTLEGYIVFIKERNENARIANIYNRATQMMRDAVSETDFKAAANEFSKISGKNDADKLANECLEKAEIARKDKIYNEGVELFNTTKEKKISESAQYFEKIKGWRDADDYLDKIPEKIANAQKEELYNYCKGKYNYSNNVTELNSVILSLESLNGWGDSEELIKKIESKIHGLNEVERKRSEAQAEKERKQREEAEQREKELKSEERKAFIKKVIITTIIIGIISAIVFSVVNKVFIIPKKKYDKAVSLMEDGKVDEAYKIFTDLKDYKDSAAKRAEIIKTNHHLAQAGDIVSFGSYEQDNDTSNGKETIDWIVLEVKDNKAFVISEKILDYRQIHNQFTQNWSTCDMRKWLDSTFLNSAFSKEQQQKIQITQYTALDYQTEEKLKNKIFLISPDEVSAYKDVLNKSFETIGLPITDYAKLRAKELSLDDYQQNSWWTRMYAGHFSDFTHYNSLTKLSEKTSYYKGLRPVMWIDISKAE